MPNNILNPIDTQGKRIDRFIRDYKSNLFITGSKKNVKRKSSNRRSKTLSLPSLLSLNKYFHFIEFIFIVILRYILILSFEFFQTEKMYYLSEKIVLAIFAIYFILINFFYIKNFIKRKRRS